MGKTIENLIEKVQRCLTVHDWVKDGIAFIPQVGVVQEEIAKISNLSNNIKLDYAWYCISQDLNIEQSIEQVYNYVSDKERAFYISGEFRKIILSSSLLSSSIIAYIMGRVVYENRNCNHTEIIITNALTNMTDYDLDNFIYLCDDCMSIIGENEVIDIAKVDSAKKASCQYTIQLCASHGLFSTQSTIVDNESVYAGIYYAKTDFCKELLEYIEIVKQLLRTF